jgi:thiamine pyrophosphate-dependent acetolactate synthase large subunit-like protein
MIEGFGGKGYAVRTPDELSTSLKQALEDTMPSIINVHIDPNARAKPQKHHWLTS